MQPAVEPIRRLYLRLYPSAWKASAAKHRSAPLTLFPKADLTFSAVRSLVNLPYSCGFSVSIVVTKLGEKFLKQNNYLIIEQDYGDFIYDLDDITQHPLHKSKFLNSSTFSGSMMNGYDDGYYISTGQSFISHIDDIPVSKISDSDLIKIFY